MPVALQTSVDIELLIEGRRDELFKKLTSQVPPPEYILPQRVSALQAPSSYVDIKASRSGLNKHPDMVGPSSHVHPSTSQVGTPEILPPAQSAQAGPPQSHTLVDKPPSYFVLESYLSAGGSERVFKVKCDDIEHYYHAFEFREYVACPAFLASHFNLTDYSCLDVSSNESHYHYIFLSRKDNNQLPIILDRESKFLGEFELMLPSVDEILPLNLRTKDLKCFVVPREEDKDLFRETSAIRPQLTDKLFRSDVMTSYLFVPTKIMELFVKNHPSSLTLMFGIATLVHKNSKSYLEFMGITEPVTESLEEDKHFSVAIESIFTATNYKREDYILNSFTDHIQRNYLDSKGGKVEKYYCSMIAVLQSSGYGKSKLMEKMGTRTPTFYSSLQRGMGYPEESFFLARLIAELDRIIKETISTKIYCHMNNASMVVYIYILRVLFVILRNPNNKPLKGNFLIDPEIENHNFFSGIVGVDQSLKMEEIFKILFKGLEEICRHGENVDFDGINTLELKDIPIAQRYLLNSFFIEIHSKKALTNKLEANVMALLGQLGVKDLPSIFVIDEANGLRYKNQTKDGGVKYNWIFWDKNLRKNATSYVSDVSPYNVFRRVFRIFKNTWERIILIVIGASGEISIPLPEWKSDSSRRPETSSRFMESFALVQTYSVNSETVQSLTADMFPYQGINDWQEFLKSDFRKIEYFKFGRPLIYGIFQASVKDLKTYDLEAKFEECGEFNFMAFKLFGGKEYGLTNKIGLLYGMFNFAFGTNFLPSYVSKEDLIENHLMTLVKFLDEFGASCIVGGFLPEGVINFLSARYFVKFPKSLKRVFSSSVEYGLCDIGNFGELLAQFILLKNIFKCIDDSLEKVRKLVFQPVFLRDFLRELAGVQYNSVVDDYFEKFNPLLEGSQISFGYFENFPKRDIKNPFNLMARLLFSGSAATLSSYFPSIDLMIPLVLSDGRISFVGIQVKFITKEDDAKRTVSKALWKMNFPKMFPKYTKGQNDRPFASIILVIGKYNLNVSIRKRGGLKNLENKYYLVEPVTLVFKGIKDEKLLKIRSIQ